MAALALAIFLYLRRLERNSEGAPPRPPRRVSLKAQLWLSLVIGGLAFAVWFPTTLMTHCGSAYTLQCTSNLRGLQSCVFLLQSGGSPLPSFENGSNGVFRELEVNPLVKDYFHEEEGIGLCPLDDNPVGSTSTSETDGSYEFAQALPSQPNRNLLAYCRTPHGARPDEYYVVVDGSGQVLGLSPTELRERLKSEGARFEHIAESSMTLEEVLQEILAVAIPTVFALFLCINVGTMVSGTVRETYRLRSRS